MTAAHEKVNLLGSNGDNAVLGTALLLTKRHKDREVILLTNDRNLKIAANSYEVKTEKYPHTIYDDFGVDPQASASQDATLDVILRWLHATSRRMVAGSLWEVAQAVNYCSPR